MSLYPKLTPLDKPLTTPILDIGQEVEHKVDNLWDEVYVFDLGLVNSIDLYLQRGHSLEAIVSDPLLTYFGVFFFDLKLAEYICQLVNHFPSHIPIKDLQYLRYLLLYKRESLLIVPPDQPILGVILLELS